MENKIYKVFILFLFFYFIEPSKTNAQLVGTYTIDNTQPTFGSNFANFTDAILALNTLGVDTFTGVIFNVTAGQTFNERPPALYASGGVNNRIIFRKSGLGSNPVIIPNIPGTISVTTMGNFGDGVFRIAGGDNITINGIDLDTNALYTTAAQVYDYGYMLLRRNANDGCKNITIQNCNVRINALLIHTSAIFSGSFDSSGAAISVTSEGGRNENILIKGNTLRGGYHGLQIRGFNHTTAPYNFFDHFVTIDSNSILNFGGLTTEANGLYTIYVDSFNITRNTLNGNVTAATYYGIRTEAALNASGTINNNNVSISSTSGILYPVFNNSGGSGTNNFIDISFNRIFNCSTSGSSIYGIRGQASAVRMDISNNEIFNLVNTGTGAGYIIWSIPGGATLSHVYGNKIYNITFSNTSNNSTLYPIICNTTTTQTHVYKNQIYNITHNGSGTGSLIINRSNAQSCYFYNNFISQLFTPNSTSADAIRAIELNTGANQKVLYNTVYLNASSSSTTNYGNSALYIVGSVTAEVRNNIFVNVSIPGPTGGIVAAYRRSNTTLTSYDNLSNNNCFYVDTTLVRRAIFTDGTNTDNSIAAYKARVAPTRDSLSFSALPPFISLTSMPFDLRLSTLSSPFTAAGTRVTFPPINDDYFGNPRDTVSPDIGAYEVSFVLPVNLTYFKGNTIDKDVFLNWQTANEINNKGFGVERSVDGKNFNEIAFVMGQGNSTTLNNYTYTDINAANLSKNIYYRLKQVDFDGSTTFSDIVVISQNAYEFDNEFIVYPNPFTNDIVVQSNNIENKTCTIIVYDSKGKPLLNDNFNEGISNKVINLAGFKSGLYFIQIKNHQGSKTYKIVKE
ncbi:MAG: T9SS type A sorting domain-containing protein [Bacteroidia bacterium]